jgi:preprotein translocase subunit SecA
MNDQRKVVYEQRREIMGAGDVAATIADMRSETIEEIVARAIPENALPEQWDIAGLHAECSSLLALDLPLADWAREEGSGRDEIGERISAAADRKMAEKSANCGSELMRMAEKSLLLQLLDQTWKDHLLSLDHLRQGIYLRGYAQRDPLNEYKREAFDLFQTMLTHLRRNITSVLSHVELRVPQPVFAEAVLEPEPAMVEEVRAVAGGARPLPVRPRAPRRGGSANGGDRGEPQRARPPWAGTPRNAPCPCGSGKKFKHCHGRV